MDQALLVGGMEAAAGLLDDGEDSGDAEPGAAVADEAVEGDAGEQRHDEERLPGSLGLELPDVVDADDIGVNHVGQERPLVIEHGYGFGIDVEDGFEGDFALHETVEGGVDDSHASFREDLAEFVALLKLCPI